MSYTPSLVERQRAAVAQKLYAATKRKDLTPPRTYVNTTTSGIYQGHGMASNRQGANDALLIPSKGPV